MFVVTTVESQWSNSSPAREQAAVERGSCHPCAAAMGLGWGAAAPGCATPEQGGMGRTLQSAAFIVKQRRQTIRRGQGD